MIYPNITYATFLARRNRFVAEVAIAGEGTVVHVKNTGRLGELLYPGARVALTEGTGPHRKTKFDLVAAEKPGLGWVNIDSQATNIAMAEWLQGQGYDLIRPEVTHGASRLDFYLEAAGRPIWMEVKGCTLECDGVGYFPDAPTDRGRKHLAELAALAQGGAEARLAFVIPMPGVRQVLPNGRTDPRFALALADAREAGVRLCFYPCRVGPAGFEITEEIIK